MSSLPFSAATALVAKAKSVAVIGHIRPDADAIGSVTTLLQAFAYLGKDVTGWIGQTESFASNLLTIPLASDVKCADQLPQVDLHVVVDCGSIDRTGSLREQLETSDVPLIMVDHHASNAGFGTVNLLDQRAESTTTILREWLRDLAVPLTHDIAHSLYAGLVTDTGSFRWGRPEMHSFASELLAQGLDTRVIAGQLIDDISLDGLKMVGTVLSGIELHRAGDLEVAILTAPHEVIESRPMSEVEGLVDYVRGIDSADLSAVFKEYAPGWFAVSLRTTKDIDVSLIAAKLGGGGHVQAAGYTTEGTIADVHQDLLRAAQSVGV